MLIVIAVFSSWAYADLIKITGFLNYENKNPVIEIYRGSKVLDRLPIKFKDEKQALPLRGKRIYAEVEGTKEKKILLIEKFSPEVFAPISTR
jgi:hypothetical protein